MNSQLEQKVRQLADREEIKELTARYCWHVSRGEGEALAELFTDDGVLDVAGAAHGPICGREALAKFYGAGVRTPGAAIPFIHNHIIKLEGDEATGTCAIEARFSRKGESITAAGYYEDRYRRVDGRWRFAERKLFFHHVVPLSKGWAEAAEPSESERKARASS